MPTFHIILNDLLICTNPEHYATTLSDFISVHSQLSVSLEINNIKFSRRQTREVPRWNREAIDAQKSDMERPVFKICKIPMNNQQNGFVENTVIKSEIPTPLIRWRSNNGSFRGGALKSNGYPERLTDVYSRNKLRNDPVCEAPKKLVYPKLVYQGDRFMNEMRHGLRSASSPMSLAGKPQL